MPEAGKTGVLDSYEIKMGNLVTKIIVFIAKDDFVPSYHLSISSISQTTKMLLERIRKEFISQVALGAEEFS